MLKTARFLPLNSSTKAERIRHCATSERTVAPITTRRTANTCASSFLRTPVDFTRISSHFNPRRLHPVLKRVRPHRGVDYAAPTGTPVYAAGDGTVIHRGWKGGYGRAIFIRHGTRYTTVYAHLSRYVRGLRVGSKVTQGQIIGRVGRSGMATGPHLHYEFRVDGIHRNPVKVKLPPLRPLRYVEQADFRQQTWPMLVALRMPDDLQTADINAR